MLIKRFRNKRSTRASLWRHCRHFHPRPRGRKHNHLCRTVKRRQLKVRKVPHRTRQSKIQPSAPPRCHNDAERSELCGLLSLRLSQSFFFFFFTFFLSGTNIKRLTPICCRFARLLISADLGDHWGRIVHHNHVCSAVPSSSFKVTDSSASRSCIKTEVYAHGKKAAKPKRCGRKKRNKSPTASPFHSGCRRALAKRPEKVEPSKLNNICQR